MSVSYFFNQLLINFKLIFSGIKLDTSLFWLLIPLVSIWIVLEIYFSRFKKEELGWNSSLANAISLIWVILPALRNVISEDLPLNRYILIVIATLYSIFIIYLSFTHSISSKIVYRISDPSPIYFMAIIVILWSYIPTLPWNLYIIIDLLLLFGFVILFMKLIKLLIPSSQKDEESSEDTDDMFSSMKNETKTQDKLDFNSEDEPVDSFIDKAQDNYSDPFSNPNEMSIGSNVSTNQNQDTANRPQTDLNYRPNQENKQQVQKTNQQQNPFIQKRKIQAKHKGLNHKLYVANNPNFQKEFQENVDKGEYKNEYDHYFERYNQ